MVPLLSVRMTHNTETTFSTFSRDLCSGTFPYFPRVSKGNVGHVTAGNVRGDASVQLYCGCVLIASIGGTFARRSCDEQY